MEKIKHGVMSASEELQIPSLPRRRRIAAFAPGSNQHGVFISHEPAPWWDIPVHAF
jgi:hypothetical protein